MCGTIQRFLLHGDHEGDVFATGGEMEIIQVCNIDLEVNCSDNSAGGGVLKPASIRFSEF